MVGHVAAGDGLLEHHQRFAGSLALFAARRAGEHDIAAVARRQQRVGALFDLGASVDQHDIVAFDSAHRLHQRHPLLALHVGRVDRLLAAEQEVDAGGRVLVDVAPHVLRSPGIGPVLLDMQIGREAARDAKRRHDTAVGEVAVDD